ncbi:TKL protein kinase [Fonticula alba]|uniref:TKL protein kinase n=1 Tax=Fonticula alba TaxID=691883 RepID=A0A058Z1J9_FONAL|nr:TKL protein kinase [Fonticula alba]KCV67813.1 TKL protein kinase [Fonticula alba]|eukprot:XP_009497844.1 TKL protein kinase [Fonticula alba]
MVDPRAATAGSRRHPPGGRLAVLVLWLLLAIASIRGEDIYFHAAVHRVSSTPGKLTFTHAYGAPSFVGSRETKTRYTLQRQVNLPEKTPEKRWGLFFGAERLMLSCPRADNPGTADLMLLPWSAYPYLVVVEHTRTTVALFTEEEVYQLPRPDIELLAGIPLSGDAVLLLGLIGQLDQSRLPFLARLDADGLTVFPWYLGPMEAGPGFGAAGTGTSVFLGAGTRLIRLSSGPGSMTVDLKEVETPSRILGLAVTRIMTPAATCPDGPDVVVLLADQKVMVYSCFGGTGPTGNHSVDLRPEVPPAGSRILAPEAAVLTDRPAPFYILSPGAADPRLRAWQVSSVGTQLRLSRVALPPVAADNLAGVELARLVGTAGDPVEWTLAAASTALFSSAAFRCPDDRSIVCDSANQMTGHSRGWTCAPRHAESPYVSATHLCAGCANGSFLDRPIDEPPLATSMHVCRACPHANCLTCNSANCLVCASDFRLEASAPDGSTRCVASCSAGFRELAGVCCPESRHMARASLSSPTAESLPGLALGDRVTFVGESWLSVDELTGRPILPGLGSPSVSGVLIFTELRKSYFLPRMHVGMVDKPPLREIHLFASPPATMVTASVEVGPFLHAGQLLYLVFVCTSEKAAYQAWLTCAQATGPCIADEPPGLGQGPSTGCSALRRLDAGGFALKNASLNGARYRANPATRSVELVSPMSSGSVTLPVVPATGARAAPAHGAWLLWTAYAQLPSLLPQALLEGLFFRREPFDGRLLANPPSMANNHHTVLVLPRPTPSDPAAPMEVVLPYVVGSEWVVLRVPGEMLVSGRPSDLPYGKQVLGVLPGPVPPPKAPHENVHFYGVPLSDLALGPEYPSALVLLGREFFGLSLLHCPNRPRQPCALQPAVFGELPSSMRIPEQMALWGPVVSSDSAPAASAATSTGRSLSFLAFSPATGPLNFSVALECPIGTFGPACDPCDGLCVECTGPGPTACTACRYWLAGAPEGCLAECPAGTLPMAGGQCGCPGLCEACSLNGAGETVCDRCLPGYGLDMSGPELDRCLACDEACETCARPGDPGACTTCPAAAPWLHGGACVSACPAGMWPDSGVCRVCAPGCLDCSSTGQCVRCAARHFLQQGGPGCIPCDGSCAACDNGSSCSACQSGLVFLGVDEQVASLCGSACLPGEYIHQGRCARCHDSCQLCAGEATACQVCAEGFRWSDRPPGGGATEPCVPCSQPGCTTCTVDACLACRWPLVLDGHGGCVADCQAGTYSNGESCQPCDVSCATCIGPAASQCDSCAPGLDFLADGPGRGACISGCVDGQYRQGATCQPCDAACATCNGPSDRDCWRCMDGVLQGTECVQDCATGHVALAGRCLRCHASCEACAGTRSTECTTCPGHLLRLPANPGLSHCLPSCPASYHTSASGCVACGDHCTRCPESVDACAMCNRGWLLAGPACVATCPAGASAQGPMCVWCHEECATCYGPGADQCLSCPAGAPILFGDRCHEACPAGTFTEDGICMPCSSTCGSCSGPGPEACTACSGDRALHQGACTLACPRGTFAEEHVCLECRSSCATCAGADACTSCPGGYMLQPDGSCAAACPEGWHACMGSGRCVACPADCLRCELLRGEDCPTGCTLCMEGFVRTGDTCARACPAGQYQHPIDRASCWPCGPECATCFGSGDFCTGCRSGFLHPSRGTCVDTCPAGSAVVDGMCVGCFAGCERCTAAAGGGELECALEDGRPPACPDVRTCDQCLPGLLLLEATSCVEACPAGYYADGGHDAGSPATCLPCHESCADLCVGPGRADCRGPRGRPGSSVGLAVGLAVGLLLLAILLVLLAVLLRRHRAAARATGSKSLDTEDATMLNTIVELALPGALLVSVDMDFRPLADKQLGAGTQASVYAAQAVGAGVGARLGCPDVVAVKRMKADPLQPMHHALFENEVALMWVLRDHPNIVRLYGYGTSPPAIVMERFDCDLSTLLHSEVPLSVAQLWDICQQWAAGLEAMHTHGVAHGDLKPGNVFVSQTASSWRAALGDLGTSRNLSASRLSALVNSMPELNAMSVRYAAPELLDAFQRSVPLDPGLFFPVDMYAAGVMLGECLARTAPWAGMSMQDIKYAVRGGARPSVELLAQEARDLVQAAWQEDPSRRPLAATFRQRCAAQHVVAVRSLPASPT